MHKPVTAQVHGTCIGIGTDLAWLCDMVIVADDARIGFPPVRDLARRPAACGCITAARNGRSDCCSPATVSPVRMRRASSSDEIGAGANSEAG